MIKKSLIMLSLMATFASAYNGGCVMGLSIITSPVDSKVYFCIKHSLVVDRSQDTPAWAAWKVCVIEYDAVDFTKNAITFSLLEKALLDQTFYINLNSAVQKPIMGTSSPYYWAVITDWSISR